MKARILTALLLAIALVSSAQESRPKVAVVLSGGGAKGVAHIGALKVIEEAGLPVDIVCGTSMGSLIGGLYALGYGTATLDSLVRAQDWTHLLTDRDDPSVLSLDELTRDQAYALEHELTLGPWRAPGGGVIAGVNLNRLFTHLCSGYLDSIDFDTLPIPFACVATNIVDNSEIDFRSGHIIQAMRASMAIPGVFTPVRMGNMVLVDGGLRNNYPADIARTMGADIIIGVTVQGPPLTADDLGDAVSVMGQIIDVNCKNKYDANVAMSDLVVHVDVQGYSSASFYDEAIDTLILRGEREARHHWDELVALRQRLGAGFTPGARPSRKAAPMYLDPKEAVRKVPVARVGFRFDTEELGALQFGFASPLGTRWPANLHLSLRLGQRIAARAELNGLFNLAFTFRRNDLDIYTRGTRSYNVKYRQYELDLLPLNINMKRSLLRLGLRWEYFDYYGQLLSLDGGRPAVADAGYFSYRAELVRNTENRRDYPTRGYRLRTLVAYHNPKPFVFDAESGVAEASLYWQASFSPMQRLALRPMVGSRLLLGGDVPPVYLNALGGEWAGHYVEQQMPFAGVGHLQYAERYLAMAGLQADYRLGKHHHLLLRAAYGRHTTKIDEPSAGNGFYGVQAGYSYTTLLGPVDLRLGYSNLVKGWSLYAGFGREF